MKKAETNLIHIPLSLWGLAFLAILYLTLYLSGTWLARKKEIQAMIAAFYYFPAVYLLVLIAGKPAVLFQTELFSPYRYTMNAFIPSLGHLFIIQHSVISSCV